MVRTYEVRTIRVAGEPGAGLNGGFKRFVRAFVEALTSQLVSFSALSVGALVFGVSAVAADQTFKGFAWGVAGGFAAVLIIKWASLLWEFRHENETLINRTCEIEVRKDGTEVVYRTSVTIRARRKNLQDTAISLGWSGEDVLVGNPTARVIGPGYTFSYEYYGNPHGANVIFKFTKPLRHFRKTTVGIEFTLAEPNRAYTPFLSGDMASFAWSLNSTLVYEVSWDATQPVDPDTIEAVVFRSAWDRHRETTAPIQHHDHTQLQAIPNGRRWTVRPVRSDRYYRMDFGLRKQPKAIKAG